jgi:hypothetical protein
MSHLTPEQIERYLDGELTPPELEAARAHLAGCDACRAELAAARELFALLAALPDDPPPQDISAAVLQRIAPPRWGARAWGLVAAQALAIAALAALLAPALAETLAPLGRAAAVLVAPPDPDRVVGWAPPLQELWAPPAALDLGPLGALSPTGWAALLGAAALAWLLGNRFLLARLGEPARDTEVSR